MVLRFLKNLEVLNLMIWTFLNLGKIDHSPISPHPLISTPGCRPYEICKSVVQCKIKSGDTRLHCSLGTCPPPIQRATARYIVARILPSPLNICLFIAHIILSLGTNYLIFGPDIPALSWHHFCLKSFKQLQTN